MRRLKIADDLVEKYGYPQQTDAIRDDGFGRNAARLFGIDPEARRKATRADKLSAQRGERRDDPSTRRNTPNGWIWVAGGAGPTTPVSS